MAQKTPCSPPQLFRVALNQEQTILSACSLATTLASNNGMPVATPRLFRASEHPSTLETPAHELHKDMDTQ